MKAVDGRQGAFEDYVDEAGGRDEMLGKMHACERMVLCWVGVRGAVVGDGCEQ